MFSNAGPGNSSFVVATEKTVVSIYQQPSEAAQRLGLEVLTAAVAATENRGSGDQS
jgi:hypothetical protein